MKAYLRYVPTTTFGVVASSAQCTDVLLDAKGKRAVTACLEEACAFDLRQGAKVLTMRAPGPTLEDPEADVSLVGEVTALAQSPDGRTLAVGYASGAINLFEAGSAALKVTLHGHRAAVAALCFARSGTVLASGGRDTDVILWDLITESGLYRLRGHKDGVTGVCLLENPDGEGGWTNPTHAISASKDALVKVWDLQTQHCVQTLTGHRSEVWSLALSPQGDRLLTGAADRQLRMWAIDSTSQEGEEGVVATYMGSVLREAGAERCLNVVWGGSGAGGWVAAQGAGKDVDVFRVRSAAEAKRKMKRRMKRVREKGNKRARVSEEGGEEGGEEEEHGSAWGVAMDPNARKRKKGAAAFQETEEEAPEEEAGERQERLAASDELEWVATVRTSHKVRACAFFPPAAAAAAAASTDGQTASTCRLLLAMANNSLETYSVNMQDKTYALLSTLDGPGHRSDVRAVALSSDDALLASVCGNQLKVWNKPRTPGATPQCLRTTPLGQGSVALCLAFLPGDRHVVIGTKEGAVHLADLSTGDLLETHTSSSSSSSSAAAAAATDDDTTGEDGGGSGHRGAVWSVDVRPDGKGLCTGGADREVKFWEMELLVTTTTAQPEEGEHSGVGGGRLTLVHTRTLKLADEVMCVRYSRTKDPDKLLIAVALLDSTVKVFYDNSLRFFLSLYGHKLPVMCMDMSDDNELIATGSADKTVKLWGLDFGDCHRSLLAHQDNVMCLRFVPGTHCFFTGGKDKQIKYWDADHFERIVTHAGHQAEVWGLAMAGDGAFFASCGHDRSIRIWERSDDQVFLEEERNRELEVMFEADVEKGEMRGKGGGKGQKEGEGDKGEEREGNGAVPAGEESALASRRSLQSVKNAERLGEALEVALQDEAVAKAHPPHTGKPRPPNPLMLGLPAPRYILFHLRLVKGPDLEQALLVLTLDAIRQLLRYLAALLEENVEVELCWRCTAFLLKTHHTQIMHCRDLVPVLARLRGTLKARLHSYRDGLGVNAAGLRLLKREVAEDRKHWKGGM